MSSWRLDGKQALITGATKGIGLAIAEELLALGAEVFITARSEHDVTACVERWKRSEKRAHGLVADVARADDRNRVVQDLLSQYSRLDILVNNVGTNIRKKTMDYSDEEYEQLMVTNLKSTFEMCRLCHPLLKESGAGAIVNVASVGGLTALPTGAIYAMTKAAIIQLTANLAVEWAPDRIRVNAVAPWYIRTPLTQGVLSSPEYFAKVLARTPLSRIGEPREVATAVAYFCLPESSFITGQCLAVDGGFMAKGF